MFRFAATDYYSDYVTYKSDGVELCDAKIAKQTVFLNFDVISLTFFKDGESFVVPVVTDSQDIVPDVTNPVLPEDKWAWLKDIVKVLAVVLLVAILWNPVMDLINMISRLLKGGARR